MASSVSSSDASGGAAAHVAWIVVIVSHFLRALGGDDLVQLGQHIRQTFAEMRHHGMVERRLHDKSGQTDEVLHIGILADRRQGFSIGQLHALLNDQRAEPIRRLIVC